MFWTNYHSHTKYCDGSSEPELYIKEAISKCLPAYGYSSHAPVNFETDWCILDRDFGKYISDIDEIKKKYQSKIQAYSGVEIDFIPDVAGRYKNILKNYLFDYFIGSIHFVDKFKDGTHWNIDTSKELFIRGLKEVFNNNFQRASERFYELSCQMIEEDNPDVIGHLDKIKMFNENEIYFKENETWYKQQVLRTLNKIKQAGTIVEVNTRGFYRYDQKDLYPSAWIIKEMVKQDIPIMLNSDAHAPNEIVSGFEYASKVLLSLGVKVLWILYDNKWQAKSFTSEGIIW